MSAIDLNFEMQTKKLLTEDFFMRAMNTEPRTPNQYA